MKSCGAECNGHKHPSIFSLSHSKVNGFQKSSSLSGASAGSSVKCSLTQSNIIIKESLWHIFRTLSGSLNHSGLRAIHHVTVSASLEGFFGLQWSQRSTVFIPFAVSNLGNFYWNSSLNYFQILFWGRTLDKYIKSLLTTAARKQFALKDSTSIGKISPWGNSAGHVKLLKGSLPSGVSNFRYRTLMRRQSKGSWKYSIA